MVIYDLHKIYSVNNKFVRPPLSSKFQRSTGMMINACFKTTQKV